ncbi:response regulator transcription factor [Halanaerobium kushneri]|uniref:Stage 0 sporulation protein A homolog n=1 Tax=Halanaerobium kushneri TaxID=56779 RepID=A0A1N6ZS61_9FIRM|nr:response regulator [Halanaerobium kushneri]SIR29546.1 two-component system, OmpR family, alkaline phosphatase synthesis response regulator PhoP [Halanaerobium kushneri]
MGDERDYKILIAEDDESISRLISYKFKNQNLESEVVTDGDQVLPEIEKGVYDALILDLMLPVLDGMSILNKIRENNIEIPVLILSARSQEKDILKALKSGADEYLTKPFRPEELIIRLKMLLDGVD